MGTVVPLATCLLRCTVDQGWKVRTSRHALLATPIIIIIIIINDEKVRVTLSLHCDKINKNLAIANRSRVSCINTNNNTMTLKSGLEVTQGH